MTSTLDSCELNMKMKRGFTLVEVLIATVLTLLMMAALAEGFKRLSDGIAQGRAKLTLSDRLRSVAMIIERDLAGCTVRPDPPMMTTEATGYFEYYDGPMTDNSAGTFLATQNRFGDADDVLMFTARSLGDPFVGRVPFAIVKAAADPSNYAANAAFLTESDWDTMVTITSEFAEIAYFVLPTVHPEAQSARLQAVASLTATQVYDPETGLPRYDPSYVATTVGIQDGVPQSYTIYRRVLLIRPDLNVITANTRHLAIARNASGGVLGMGGLNRFLDGAVTDVAKREMVSLQLAHQNCDLSIRRVYSGDPEVRLSVAANSLEDLARPENRFAHCLLPDVLPLGGLLDVVDTTLPVLATTQPLTLASNSVTGLSAASFSGFIRPEFVLGRMAVGETDPFNVSNPMIPMDGTWDVRSRLGEDVLLTGAAGFDIRGFDDAAQRLFYPGPDGQPGMAGVDDNSDTTTDNTSEYGWSNTDDLVLLPSDPGYLAERTRQLSTGGLSVADRGSFVDLAYGARWGLAINSKLSDSTNFIRSGALRTSAPFVFQPRYDSWTDAYELDNAFFDVRATKTVWLGGPRSTSGVSPRYDGVDNNGNGVVDDPSESETLPPYSYRLPSIQITIRAEDSGTGLIQQTSMVHEFVSR